MVTVINHKKLIFFLSRFMFCDLNSSPCSCSEFHKHTTSYVLLQSCGFLFETCLALCQVPWLILHTPPPSNKNSTKINSTYCSTSHKSLHINGIDSGSDPDDIYGKSLCQLWFYLLVSMGLFFFLEFTKHT